MAIDSASLFRDAGSPLQIAVDVELHLERPRGRYIGGGEVDLDTWDVFTSEDLLRQVVVERMLAGVATRRHVDSLAALRARHLGCHRER